VLNYVAKACEVGDAAEPKPIGRRDDGDKH